MRPKPHKAACKNNLAVQQRVPIYVAHSTMATYRGTTVRTCFLGKSLELALLGHLVTAASETSRTTTKKLLQQYWCLTATPYRQTTRTHNSLTITSHFGKYPMLPTTWKLCSNRHGVIINNLHINTLKLKGTKNTRSPINLLLPESNVHTGWMGGGEIDIRIYRIHSPQPKHRPSGPAA